MRKVVLHALLSLDGVADSPEDTFQHYDAAMDADLVDVISTQDTVLLGRRMYDEWSKFWPQSDVEPFATFINHVTKYVATSTPLATQWTNATAINGPVTDFVQILKRRTGGDIGIHGSIELAQALLRAQLVDTLRLQVAPAVMGNGRRLFDHVSCGLELQSSTSSPTGSLLLNYRTSYP